MALELYEAGVTVANIKGRKRLIFDDENDYRRAINQFADGLRLVFRLEEEPDTRPGTAPQRKYWFAVPVPICADEMGVSDDDASRDLMGECFGYEVNRFGKQVPIESSFAALTVAKRKRLIDWVLDWGPRTLNVRIHPPDKDWKKAAEAIRAERIRQRASRILDPSAETA